MVKQIVPSTGRDLIVSFNYDPTGLEWVECFDNAPLGWAADADAPSNPEPVMIGSLPPAAPDTAPIMSPQWAQFTGGYLVVPDVVRMLPSEFFSWLGTNNGATRQVRSSLKSNELGGAFHSWGGGAPAGGVEATGEAALPEGAFAPGRRGPDQPPVRREGDSNGGEHVGGGPVDPMRSSDLGESGIGSEHRGGSPAGKPSEPKSPPHPSHGRDEHHSSR